MKTASNGGKSFLGHIVDYRHWLLEFKFLLYTSLSYFSSQSHFFFLPVTWKTFSKD